MRSIARLLVLAAFAFCAPAVAGQLGPELGPGWGGGSGGGGGGSGDLTGISNTDGYLTITNGGGPAPTIDLGVQVVVQDASFLAGAGTDWDFRFATNLYLPSGVTCDPAANGVCWDTNGIAQFLGPLFGTDLSGTNYWAPTFTATQLGTAGTKRVLGVSAANAPETTVATATPTASAIPVADGSNKIADGWLSALVSLLGQTIGTAELEDGAVTDAKADAALTRDAELPWATPDATKKVNGAGALVELGRVHEKASAPSTPPSGYADCWWDTTVGWLSCTNDAGGTVRYLPYSGAAPSTGALLRWDGAVVAGDTQANCVVTSGVLTCDDFASRSAAAVSPKFHTWATGTCLTSGGNPQAMVVNGAGNEACANWSTAGSDVSMILIDDTRKSKPRTFTYVLRTVGTGGAVDAGDVVELVLSGCVNDVTPNIADCTELDAFAFELGTATSTVTYGGASANNRSTLPCNRSAGAYCQFTWTIDGLGKLGSNGTPESAAGVYDYYIVWYDHTRTPFTADTNTGDDIASIRGVAALTWDN